MAQHITLVVYPVSDIEKAKTFYTQFLGVQPYVESPYYVGYRAGDIEVGLDPNSTLGPIAYTDVDDVAATLEELKQAGAETIKEPTDVGGGLLIAQVKDSSGNVLGLRQR